MSKERVWIPSGKMTEPSQEYPEPKRMWCSVPRNSEEHKDYIAEVRMMMGKA